MTKVLRNFHGLTALVLQSEVTGRDKLIQTLRTLGLKVIAAEPGEVDVAQLGAADLIFVDADEGSEPIFGDLEKPDIPLIAIVGSEAPSRLSRVVRVRAESHIQKPVRSSGIFTAILFAINEHAQRQRSEQEAKVLRRRLAGRRIVVKAVLALMRRWGIDEDIAYQRLRSDAMCDRIPVEEAAARVLAGSTAEPTSKSRAGPLD